MNMHNTIYNCIAVLYIVDSFYRFTALYRSIECAFYSTKEKLELRSCMIKHITKGTKKNSQFKNILFHST